MTKEYSSSTKAYIKKSQVTQRQNRLGSTRVKLFPQRIHSHIILVVVVSLWHSPNHPHTYKVCCNLATSNGGHTQVKPHIFHVHGVHCMLYRIKSIEIKNIANHNCSFVELICVSYTNRSYLSVTSI